jgi:hypothetical protein
MWDIFDKSAFDASPNAKVVLLKHLVSTKDERFDPRYLSRKKDDPRHVALRHMEQAAANRTRKRVPLNVIEDADGLLFVIDGNATAQVLMMAQWLEVPVIIQPNRRPISEIG